MTDGPDQDAERAMLEAVRKRIDAVDRQLLELVDERTELAYTVGEIKRSLGDNLDRLNIRADREAQLLRALLKQKRRAAGPDLVVRIWRELISESLRIQGPFHLAVWGGRDSGRTVEMARRRFGSAPPLAIVPHAEDALAVARTRGGVAVIALEPGNRWWGRLLAEPKLSVFAALPCLTQWGGRAALAIGEVKTEPSGLDETYWVTDAPGSAAAIEEKLSRDGVAANLVMEAGGLKLFALAGYFQREDERLARAPGGLSGVIGAAPAPLDL